MADDTDMKLGPPKQFHPRSGTGNNLRSREGYLVKVKPSTTAANSPAQRQENGGIKQYDTNIISGDLHKVPLWRVVKCPGPF